MDSLDAQQAVSIIDVKCMNKRIFSHIILLWGIIFFLQIPLHAQNDLSSEEALRKEAQKVFDDEDYPTALKYYLRLLSANIKDPLYNYRYGVCLLEASADKEEAIKYMEKAVKDPSLDKEVFYYYGRALQLSYRFNDAINAYSKYKSLVSESKAKKLQIDHLIETCHNGKTLLRKITDIQVIDKKNLEEKDFFRSYDLSDIGGRLLIKPDDFRTGLDKKKKDNSIIFLSPDKNEIYFSSYGSSDENGKDIYVITRLPSGEYGKPVSLGYPINTEFDEDYPFLHPNGMVLYFASKGHNSMGGYDIFKSERNSETGAWGKPVNLDFPISTPDDDILFVTDKDEKTAYFASRRASEKGRIDVYHINLQRKPVDVCVFKGTFLPLDGKSKAAKITVKNVDINEVEAVLSASEALGEYTYNLPNGGKFVVTVETAEGDIQSDVLMIPQQFETVPIRQEITYIDGKLHVNTFFGENHGEDDKYSLVTELIKEKARMDVNLSKAAVEATQSATEKADSARVADSTLTASKLPQKHLSNEDLIKIADQDAADLDKEAKDLREAADKALQIVNDKNIKVQDEGKKLQEANDALTAATDAGDKQIQAARVDLLQNQRNNAEIEAVGANNFFNTLDSEASRKKKEADLSKQYAADLAAAIKSNSKDAMTKLDAQKEELDKFTEDKSKEDDPVTAIRKEAAAKQKEENSAREESASIREEIKGMEAEVENLGREEGATTNPQLKEGLKGQISGLKEDIIKKKNDLTTNDLKVGKLQKEAENLNSQASLVYQMNEQIKSGQVPVSSEAIDKDKLNQQISTYHPKVLSTTVNSDQALVHDTSRVITETPGDSTLRSSVVKEDKVKKDSEKDSQGKYVEQEASFTKAIADADNKTGDLEKEQAKAEAYKQWSDAISHRIEDKNTELKATTDPTRQSQLNEVITALTKEKEEKQHQADESLDKVNKLKQAPPVAASEADYARHYENRIATLDSTSGKPAQAQAKAEIYKDWASAIRNDATKKKTEMEASKDPSEKAKLKEEIAQLEKDAETKETTQKELLASVPVKQKEEDHQTEEPATVNAAVYKNKLTAVESLPTQESKDSAKAQIYQEWAASLNQDLKTRKEKLTSIIEPDKKKAEEKAISELETEVTSKNEEAARLTEIVADRKTRPVNTTALAPTDTASQTRAHSTEPAVTKTGTEPAVVKTTAVLPPVKKAVDPSYPLTSPSSVATNEERKQLETEAAILKIRADTARAQADKLSGPEHDAKQKESEDLYKAFSMKEYDASNAGAKVSLMEYGANEQKLNQYELKTNTSTDPALTQAETFTDAAKAFYAKAKEQREAAQKTDNPKLREENIKLAEENENHAIESQSKALKIYESSFPDLVIRAAAEPRHVRVDSTLDDDAIIAARVAAAKKEHDAATGHKDENGHKDDVKTAPVVVASHTDENKTGVGTDHTVVTTSHTDENKNPGHTEAVETKHTDHTEASEPNHTGGSDSAKSEHAAIVVPSHTREEDSVATARKVEVTAKVATLKAEEDVFLEAATANNHQADDVQIEGQRLARESGKMNNDNSNMPDDASKEAARTLSKEYEERAKQNFAKADSIRAVAQDFNRKAQEKKKEREDLMVSLDPNYKRSTPVKTDKTEVGSITINKETPVGDKNPVSEPRTGTKLVGGLVKETFLIATSASVPKQIELDPKMPEGLVFKVQIGAFKRTLSGDEFKGVRPLTGETTTKGFIRYTAGLFSKFESADKAKKSIQALGFKDAFVVAFLNGKRISVADAQTMIRTGEIPASVLGGGTTPPVADGGNHTVADGGNHTPAVESHQGNDQLPAVTHTNPGAIAKSTPVTGVSGLFYAVQIGVYSKPVSNEKIYGIQPLNTETLENGNLRYTSGQYADPLKAEEAKRKIVELGIKDAFVVAYKDGKRVGQGGAARAVTPAAVPAKKSETEPGEVKPNTPAIDKKLSHHKSVIPTASTVTDVKPGDFSRYDNKEIPMVKGDTGVVFKVQIGAFKEQVPIEIANKFILLAKRGVKNFTDENGLTVYTIGIVTSYDDAVFLKEEAIAKGIPDAFILAYKDGKKVSVSDVK